MRAVTANISAANPQAFVRLDNWWGAALAVQIVVIGAAAWKLSHSFDDPNDLVNPAASTGAMFWDQSLLPLAGQGGSGNLTFNLPVSPLWMQFALTSGAGPARATFVQHGVHSRSNIISGPFAPSFAMLADEAKRGDNFRAMAK